MAPSRRLGPLLTEGIHSEYSGAMSVPVTLLGLLEREPRHGYELKREYDAYFGRGKPLPFGQVYATLSRLVRDKKVTPGEIEPGDGPDRKSYAITEIGRTEVEAWLIEPVEPEPYMQTVLFAKVVLALLLGRSADGYLDAQRSVHLQRMPRANRGQEERQRRRRTSRRSRDLPPRSRPALDRLDRGPSRFFGGGVEPMKTPHLIPELTIPGQLIEAHDVVRSFGETQALRGANMSVGRGEILAIMGPSGSGKSTLLHCLAGIFKPDSGEIWFDGQRVDVLDEAKRTELRRTAFGFVFQFGQLVPELTSADNVALPLLLNKTSRKEAYRKATSWLNRLGLEGLEGRRSGELSGGQAQRVALARALVAGPKVIFADEPTGSLDSLTGEAVMNLLVDNARAEGTTVVLVTHDARVAAYADREVLVRDGLAISRQPVTVG